MITATQVSPKRTKLCLGEISEQSASDVNRAMVQLCPKFCQRSQKNR